MAPEKETGLTPKKAYLALYNFISAILWTTVLGRTAVIALARSPVFVHIGVGTFTRWTQTLAALEIIHSLLGIVRTPLLTTLMQVASRFLLVWLVVYPFPQLSTSTFYTSMLLAWSVTEVIRYTWFALAQLRTPPAAFTRLRYSTFLVLYPVGITSECALVYAALGPATRAFGNPAAVFLWGVLATYVPGSWVLYTHMLKQRKSAFRKLREEEEARETGRVVAGKKE